MKLFFARASSSQASKGCSGAIAVCESLSNADEEEGEDGEHVDGSRRKVWGAGDISRPCYTLFIDGIADSVGYFQVRDLFQQHGKMSNVFLQRKKKHGRKFRFGFVRFALKENTISAMKHLDGIRLGRAFLLVKLENILGLVGRLFEHMTSCFF